MPSAIGEIRGDLKDAQDCIKKDVHNCEEKIRNKIEQKKRACEERRAERLMVFTTGISEDLVATQKDAEETEKTTTDGEKNREMTPEKGSQAEIKQNGKAKKGKTAEESEVTKNGKETPAIKEKRTPRGGAKKNTNKRKKVSIQEAEEIVELHDSLGKKGNAYEEEEMKRLRKVLYEERRKKEDLVRERIRLERQNEKFFIKNNHLKRKQAEGNAQRGKYAPEKALAMEGHREYRRENKGRREQNEREDLKRAIVNSRRKFREREYLMHQSTMAGGKRSNIPVTKKTTGLQPEMMNKCAKNEPCMPEIAALFSLK
ncbi:troponin T, cardiac muscle-like [Papaver somniferum]|uniref:troponin T, cardiac muscle-like n=1 Tax=Papaver somniferum TaxID=3469 RepID=UPI000E6F8DB9|nr:troponin T, cardiac muscle-like [Papaver somniferum]